MAKADRTAPITPKCQRIAEEMGFELVEVALDKEPTGLYLRIYIDRPEGITLDDCEKYHRAVMPLVENFEYDFMEVSSPGVDRPLKTDRDFERNIGTEVEVLTLDGTKLKGILKSVDGEQFVVTVEEKVRVEGKKRPELQQNDYSFEMTGVKYCKYLFQV